jgi:CTP:molybdopterin cytidylyltransferase MocA
VNKRPGQVNVTTEVAYCSFCDRPRTLRREERHLGALVRTVVTCETCHRTLSSSIGVAAPEAAAEPVLVAAEPDAPIVKAKTTSKRAPVKKAPAKTAAAKGPAKPTSTASRRAPKKK